MDKLYLAPLVVAFRLPIIWMQAVAPTAAGKRETDLMYVEKISAASSGFVAAQIAAVTGATAFWTAIMFGRAPGAAWQTYLNGINKASLAPVRSTVAANARRLRGRRDSSRGRRN